MIQRHTGKHGSGVLKRMPSPVQGDGERERRNGYPAGIYLPADPDRRERLLQLLGYLPGNNSAGEDADTDDTDWSKSA